MNRGSSRSLPLFVVTSRLIEIRHSISEDVPRGRAYAENIGRGLSFSLCALVLLPAIADAGQTGGLVFLSTQLRPIEEAQKMRNVILKGFPQEVDYITEQPQQFPVRIKAEQEAGTHTIDVVGALHGELPAARGTGRVGPAR